MPPTPPNQKMGDLHEEYLAHVNGGRRTRGSGNQWSDPSDGVNDHDIPFSYRWDGKSTKGKSLSVSREQIEKLREETFGEQPQFGLRWYLNEMLTAWDDWILVPGGNWEEVLPAARNWAELEAATGYGTVAEVIELLDSARESVARERAAVGTQELVVEGDAEARALLDQMRAELSRVRNEAAGLQAEAAALRVKLARRDQGIEVPEHIPHLPWTAVHVANVSGRAEKSGVYYDGQGYRSTFTVTEVRVERSPNGLNRPRLVVNNRRVSEGDLYVDSRLKTRVSVLKPAIEVG